MTSQAFYFWTIVIIPNTSFCVVVFILWVRVFCFNVCEYTPVMQCLQRLEEDIGSPRIRVWDGYSPPHECWELDLGLLQEQSVPLQLSHLCISSFNTFNWLIKTNIFLHSSCVSFLCPPLAPFLSPWRWVSNLLTWMASHFWALVSFGDPSTTASLSVRTPGPCYLEITIFKHFLFSLLVLQKKQSVDCFPPEN